MSHEAILSVRGLRKDYRLGRGWTGRVGSLTAVDGVDLDVHRGEVLGVVGESGSGKTTLGRCILRLVEPSGGEITFAGEDFRGLTGRELRNVRRRIQIVYQDPYASLNPRLSVDQTVAEPLTVHRIVPPQGVTGRVRELLERVGLDETFASRYPHELSGGQRQRVALARALAPEPDLLVADEPVSALDVSVQAQILELFRELKRRGQVAMLFISHDLAVVERIADRVVVMYEGRIVEAGPTGSVIREPLHPYTRALLSSAPTLEPAARHERVRLRGDTGVGFGTREGGCAMAGRCPFAEDVCRSEVPPLAELAPGRRVACHLADGQ